MASFYDILLDDNGDLPIITTHTRGWLAIVQRVKFRLQTFEGEWLLDFAVGMPYIRWRSQKVAELNEISAFVQREVLGTPGVIRIVSFEDDFIEDEQKIYFRMELEVEDIADSVTTQVNFFPFGQTQANSNPIAAYVGPSKTVL